MELDPRSSALVLVHCQGDVLHPDGAFADMFHQQVVERDIINRLVTLRRAVGGTGCAVIYTRVAWQSDYCDLDANSPLLQFVAESGSLKEGSRLADIVDELAPQQGDIVVTHRRVGGFTGSTLDATLRDNGIDTLLFAGVATNVSVESTARAASDLGYRVVVIDDACAAASPETHSAAVSSLSLLAETVQMTDVFSALPMTRPVNCGAPGDRILPTDEIE